MRYVLPCLLLAACSDYEFNTKPGGLGADGPQIQVEPEQVLFGGAGRDETIVETFTVSNVGGADLQITGMEMSSATGSFTILTPEEDLSFLLPPSASETIEVAFTPLGADEQRAVVTVFSSDEDSPAVPVELTGEGYVPELVIDPDPYDFGEAYIGCPRRGDINLVNVGYDSLTVDGVEVSGGGGAYTLLSSPALPLLLEPGEEAMVQVDFGPTTESTHTGSLSATHDAPGGVTRSTITGSGRYAGEYQERWDIPEEPPVDLIFSVDQSGSMNDDANLLANSFAAFINQLSDHTTDWRIIVANDDDGCNQGGILTAGTPGYADTFQYQVQRGGGRHTEALLTVTSNAVSRTSSSQCNAGFMRSDALLHIIMVSDEPEQSSSSWSTYVDSIVARKGDSSLVRLSAIAGDYPGGCGTAQAGTGYYEAVQATGGLFLSICSNWGTNVEALADASVQLAEYSLDYTPDPSTITVRVNGTVIGAGWYYDAVENMVVFEANIPEGGDTVIIAYSALANCD